MENETPLINLPPLHDPAKAKRQQILKVVIAIFILVVLAFCVFLVVDELQMRRLDAESVILQDDLNVKFGQPTKVSDFLVELKGSLVDDHKINTEALGEQEITFEYINYKNRKRKHHFTIKVVDTTKPKVYGGIAYTVPVNYEGDLTDLMLSGDDLDDHPQREVTGDYDLSIAGSYNLKYIVTDASGNYTEWPFILHVVVPSDDEEVDIPDEEPEKLDFKTVIKDYRTAKTRVGIDVSNWQSEIDWAKVKAAGAEFAFIRLGYQNDFDGEYVLDKRFTENIQGALAVGLPVGVYFYSYANSLDQARQQAEWVAEQINDYQVELGVAYDWENWSEFNHAGVSFYTLNQSAKTFIDTLENLGYQGLLYGSKSYLESFWNLPDYDKWLAQYYDRPTYTGSFRFWQMSDQGKIDGINTDVDIDIMYLDENWFYDYISTTHPACVL